eukprot:scaffold35225_cov155-Skeletonema_dohrnii-CCMP3373.AAC.1
MHHDDNFTILPAITCLQLVTTPRISRERRRGARAVPEDARGTCWVRVGRRRWMANALVQARPNLEEMQH